VAGTEQTDRQSSGSNGVTDKKSSSILIIRTRAWIFIQKLVALLKPNVNEVFIKNRTFLMRDGILIKG
jgi:hypothetical protein